MLLSNLLPGRKVPAPRFAPGLFLALLIIFIVVGQAQPTLALVGIGTTILIAGALIELNRKRIWETYLKSYKKQKGLAGAWNRPSELYYNINVYFLWPFVMFLGAMCLYAAYLLS
jgi:hypothetical protein